MCCDDYCGLILVYSTLEDLQVQQSRHLTHDVPVNLLRSYHLAGSSGDQLIMKDELQEH